MITRTIYRKKSLSEIDKTFEGMDDFSPRELQFTIFIMSEYRKFSKYPSYRKFIEWFGMTYYQIQKLMNELQRQGVIEIHGRSGYVLTPDWLIRALTKEMNDANKYIETFKEESGT